MSIQGQADLEFVNIKVFLYKYTPKFTISTPPANTTKATLTKVSSQSKRSDLIIQAFLQGFNGVPGVFDEAVRLRDDVTKFLANPALTKALYSSNPVSSLSEAEKQALVKDIKVYLTIPFGNPLRGFTNMVVEPNTEISKILEDGVNALLSVIDVQVQYARDTVEKYPGQVLEAVRQNLGVHITADTLLRMVTIPVPPTPSDSIVVDDSTFIPTTDNRRLDAILNSYYSSVSSLGFTTSHVEDNSGTLSLWRVHLLDLKATLDRLLSLLNTLRSQQAQSNAEFQAVVEKPFKTVHFSFTLDEDKFFSKFDISRYVDSYQFSQQLKSQTPSWSLNCQDAVIPFEQLRAGGTSSIRVTPVAWDPIEGTGRRTLTTRHSIYGPTVRQQRTTSDVDLIRLMAEYESEEVYNFDDDVATIEQAMLDRGQTSSEITSDISQSATGIKLSTLTQKYNLISTFVYKSSIPIKEAIKQRFPKRTSASGQVIPEGFVSVTAQQVTPFDENNEVHLTLIGYKNEFNGFVTSKDFTKSVGRVDHVSIKGHGILRLLSDTRRFYVAELASLPAYDTAEQITLSGGGEGTTPQIPVFQNNFADKTPVEIIETMLLGVYRLKVHETHTGTYIDTRNGEAITFQELRGHYDIAALKVFQTLDRNLFVIPPFLLATVMRLRNYDHTLTKGDVTSSVNAAQKVISSAVASGVGASATPVTDSLSKIFNAIPHSTVTSIELPGTVGDIMQLDFSEDLGGPSLQISATVDNYKSYLQFIRQGWSNHMSQLKTPAQILDELIENSQFEFFERPNGRIIFRSPQYNETIIPREGEVNSESFWNSNTLTSDQIAVLSTTYAESSIELVSRLATTYESDLVADATNGIFQPAYTNGKLLSQYGLRTANTKSNPNVSAMYFKKLRENVQQDLKGNRNLIQLIHQYIRMDLERQNAALNTGQLEVEGAPSVEVGKLFWDKTNSKIGYITGVTKSLKVGDTYTTSISLSMVRDVDTSLHFRRLPTLEELVSAANNADQVNLNAVALAPVLFRSVPPIKITYKFPGTLATSPQPT